MLIAGYYDASKTADDGQPILAVAGFVSSNIQWHYDFCGPWQRVLKQQGLEYFHMTDYETRQPPYADWDEDRRKRVLTELLAIIGRSVVFGAGAAVFLNDYNALSEGDRKVVGTPYHLCALWCGRLTKEQLDQDKRQEDVAFVFEAGDVGHGEVSAGLNAASEISGTHVLSVTFKDKRDYPAATSSRYFRVRDCQTNTTRCRKRQPYQSEKERRDSSKL